MSREKNLNERTQWRDCEEGNTKKLLAKKLYSSLENFVRDGTPSKFYAKLMSQFKFLKMSL